MGQEEVGRGSVASLSVLNPFVGLLLVCIVQASYFLKGKETLML